MTASTAPLTVGEALPNFEDCALTRTDFVRYQNSSGDVITYSGSVTGRRPTDEGGIWTLNWLPLDKPAPSTF